ncbi:MAG: YciK family oxidoreductase [Gammaproteobacteria bacterium]|nr:YciK family oxidoreductase [Gammaproteobacteria bacterium]
MSIISNFSTPKMCLKNKSILITGAASGIGKTVSLALAKQGAVVILLDKKVELLEQLYDQIELEGGAQPAIYPMDLNGATPQDYEDLYKNISNEFLSLDGLIHNAALLGTLMPLMQHDLEHWYKVMQINLHAPYLLTRACLPLMISSEHASILFTSDDVGIQGKAYWGAYGVSKAGSDNLMQILADELETNTHIRVNSINPGVVASAMRTGAYPAENPNSLTQPEDITQAYIYMMSDESKDVNGQVIEAQNKFSLKSKV